MEGADLAVGLGGVGDAADGGAVFIVLEAQGGHGVPGGLREDPHEARARLDGEGDDGKRLGRRLIRDPAWLLLQRHCPAQHGPQSRAGLGVRG